MDYMAVYNNVRQFKEALTSVLTDADLRKRMGNLNIKKAILHDIDTVIHQIKDIYKKVTLWIKSNNFSAWYS